MERLASEHSPFQWPFSNILRAKRHWNETRRLWRLKLAFLSLRRLETFRSKEKHSNLTRWTLIISASNNETKQRANCTHFGRSRIVLVRSARPLRWTALLALKQMKRELGEDGLLLRVDTLNPFSPEKSLSIHIDSMSHILRVQLSTWTENRWQEC